MAETTQGRFTFYEHIEGQWAFFFSFPRSYHPVCTTELGRVANLISEFDKLGVKVLALSVDLRSHMDWIKDINETQNCAVKFPLIFDPDRKIANLYGMIPLRAKGNLTARSVFFIGPDKKIKMTLIYPMATGRNFEDILRTIKSLQLAYEYEVATPPYWQPGEEGGGY